MEDDRVAGSGEAIHLQELWTLHALTEGIVDVELVQATVLPRGEVSDRVPLPVRMLVGAADSRVTQNLTGWHRHPSNSIKWF